MPTFLFTLLPSGVGHLHELLSCLAKFDEDVSLEATSQFLRFSSLNISKTTHAAFILNSAFFQKYHFSAGSEAPAAQNPPRVWTCKVQIRALLSIFKRRLAESRDKDTALETCECELQANSDQAECRLIFRLNCKQGVIKTYRLFYESGEILHATFDRVGSTNHWTVSSRTLRDVVEYFGPKTDQLDWFYQDGKVTFTSYTEKIQSGREILKQPMHTSVALERKDFDGFDVQEGLHIGTMVKDFRAIVAHAEAMRVQVTARYSRGNRPMQISYESNGLVAEFTLMTRGTSNVPNTSQASTPAREISMRSASRPPETLIGTEASTAVKAKRQAKSAEMPPPARTSFHDTAQPSLTKTGSRDGAPAPSASINPDSLFIPADDDDQQWDEPNFEEEADIVTWDNTSEDVSASSSVRRIRDSESHSFAQLRDQAPLVTSFPHEIAPTQRLSQVRGIFD
ncbi:uncharacterized protein A1O9_04646 [Exophiala aquamarina CBS 119918]|uniref:DNA repair protein rad9 n=1 Tax=Exophiala aquamarina CBS 119918 TaxID=1182545 RepID=A0A072PKH1_9EURO|nr:uncharacterized protein A1O9_04646 [Exophiala aquamarina CBS 119918]KEF59798.1 hypothetical protein A1O9_04646 [Exophiala aquamarina CBS 119918]